MKEKMESVSSQDPILDAFQDAKKEQATEEQLELLDNTENSDVEENHRSSVSSEGKVYKGYDGTEYSEEEWLSTPIKNGPTRKEIEGWKNKYSGYIYFVPFEGDVFIFRALQRPEYREIVSNTTLTALDREEAFTEKCVIYPYDFSLEKIKKSRAGIASLLAEMIMEKSGFVAQTAPIKL
ncbi:MULTISPECIES: hypothetical protein [Bacillus subtilis group]|uniref:hypothetical protein n=1 Tax=Bacillus subtilis group TaxID=653685 RepID=UPI001B1E22B8|nr:MULTISPECIES: hypothetical protein [Bacillus subtilis group]MED4337967.1 hypothetical protein [Bacillus licheniformis]MED4371029.1 hypothetical protein [Bacillus licheniformis]GIN55163.1 hypothetical protein J36TS2_40570 [Bacillus paralicheniformis]